MATTSTIAVAATSSAATLSVTNAGAMGSPPLPSRSAPITPSAPPPPPPYLRVRCTITRTLLGAVYECEQPDDAAEQLRLFSPPLAPSSPLRRRASVAVKTISLCQAKSTALRVSPRRAVDDPWQEWRVAEMLRAHARVAAEGDDDSRHVLRYHHQQLLPDGDTMVLVSEYCAGGDLFSYLETQPTGTAPPLTALAFTRQIARGLRFLHTQLGVAHRDLSLENVLLRDGVCKLADFALSTDAAQRCRVGAGKEYYMAPEVVAATAIEKDPAESDYDPRTADVWSLGIVLFILLTGSPLLEIAARGEPGFSALERLGIEPVLRAWGVRAALSDDCVELLDAMLRVDPAKRISVDAVLAHAALQGL